MANVVTVKNVAIHAGDLVRISVRVVEGDKERIQLFEGMVIAIRGRDANKSFTVRKIASGGVGVERIFPVESPWITKIEVKKAGAVRRAKLYYVREKSARQVASITQTSN